MLENLTDIKSRMQADEIGEVLRKDPEQFASADMTYKNTDLKQDSPLEEASIVGSNSKFEGINLDDDIEKVEVTSQDSSTTDEDEASTPEAPGDLDGNVFSTIPTQNSSESIKHWLQRITDMQQEIQRKYGTSSGSGPSVTVKPSASPPASSASGTSLNPNRVVKYQDLPYMGEITLDNSKPRRGRKPKKADICHLIYKNYGTIFPGTPNPNSYLEKDNQSRRSSILDKDFADLSSNRIDVQNRIISSLLERRLTQEYGRNKESKTSTGKTPGDQNEPLNLCIRDLNHLKIRLMKNDDNTYTQIKSEPQSDEDTDISPSPLVNAKADAKLPVIPDNLSTPSPDPLRTAEGATAPGGYVYWPNAGVFIHPMALQQQLMMYQRMANNNSYVLPNNHSPKPLPESSSPVSKAESSNQEMRKLVPKVVKPKPIYSKDSIQETDQQAQPIQESKKRIAANSENPAKTPAKRKRSAIFIPPIPTESTNNSATEVSICKFKFTGGAKPSLQEKKMLSVDSGGNFRYYSGTGDKSMRGYEFFPRETLQQQINNTHGSSTGAFLQASGEKIYSTPPPDFISPKTNTDFLLSPALPPVNFSKAAGSSQESHSQKHKKRKSRKSLQREKLEQTFKEKGFLIQTQQTESAEGATYCKFRQLRKFTRYLFRSWKDYLPGNIAEGEQQALPSCSENGEVTLTQMSRESNDNLSLTSSELSSGNAQ